MKDRPADLRIQRNHCQEQLCNVTSVVQYARLKLQIAFINDLLLKHYGVRDDD